MRAGRAARLDEATADSPSLHDLDALPAAEAGCTYTSLLPESFAT
jgi:hypothetical protein